LAGRLYVGFLAATVIVALVLTGLRAKADWPLGVLGSLALAAALYGRWARRKGRPGWGRRHIAAMASSVTLMLVAFYVDNGRHLPIWDRLPDTAYWAIPTIIGGGLAAWAMAKHPVARL
jgi:hypothetical protein